MPYRMEHRPTATAVTFTLLACFVAAIFTAPEEEEEEGVVVGLSNPASF